jgi:hypothetical protein
MLLADLGRIAPREREGVSEITAWVHLISILFLVCPHSLAQPSSCRFRPVPFVFQPEREGLAGMGGRIAFGLLGDRFGYYALLR